MIRRLVRTFRQARGGATVEPRPVLDTIEFGYRECVVLDVGANRGGFAGNILLRAPLARVYSFEPNPALAPVLEAKSRAFGKYRGGRRCAVIMAAVGDSSGRLQLRVTGLDAASSFLPVSVETRHGWPNTDFSTVDEVEVPVLRLDAFLEEHSIQQVKLLKLDVQGYELKALIGCGSRLATIEYVVCEVQFTPLYDGAPLWFEICDYLAGHGFRPVLMDGFCFAPDGGPLQADMLFRNQSVARG